MKPKVLYQLNVQEAALIQEYNGQLNAALRAIATAHGIPESVRNFDMNAKAFYILEATSEEVLHNDDPKS